jgi:hypothetical protein
MKYANVPWKQARPRIRESARYRWARRGLASLVVVAGFAACGNDEEGSGYTSSQCRFDPGACPGLAGALCVGDRDCRPPLTCCTDNGNCGGGMCTAECHDDRDCPLDMACEHSVCFYRCNDDRDCAVGMSCEHGSTVCEWP